MSLLIVNKDTSAPLEITGAGNIATAFVAGLLAVVLTLFSTGITTNEAFGSPAIEFGISSTGIATSEVIGSSAIGLTTNTAGIASVETIGSPNIGLGVTTSGITSAEVVGSPDIALSITENGIASDEIIGSGNIGLTLQSEGITSQEAFGLLDVELVAPAIDVYLIGVESAEVLGSPQIGIESGKSTPITSRGGGWSSIYHIIPPSPIEFEKLNISFTGIESSEMLGSPLIRLNMLASGIRTDESFGELSLIFGDTEDEIITMILII